MGKKQPKHSQHARSRAERRRRGRYVGWVVLGVPALLFVLYLIDRTGPLETVDGTVVIDRTVEGGDRLSRGPKRLHGPSCQPDTGRVSY